MTMYISDRLNSYRLVLYIIAGIGFFGLNGAFLFFALLYPETMTTALENPICLVFILEAFVIMWFFAWLIWTLRLTKPGWVAFVTMSLVGSLAFSVPSFLLLHLRKRDV